MKGKTNKHILGCRVCKNPLEVVDPIIYDNKQRKAWAEPPVRTKTRTTKQKERVEKTVAAISDRLVSFDPTPVATKCGHIFHRGCLKKLVAEKASSRIDCPACRKPTVLSQTHPVKLLYPQNGESCGQKIRRQNDENESLSCQLVDCRKTRVQRKIAYDAAISHTDKMRSEVTLLGDEIKRKFEGLKTMEINGVKILSLQEELPKVKQNIIQMSSKNSGLLKKLECILIRLGDNNNRDENLRCLHKARERFCGIKTKELSKQHSKVVDDAAAVPIGGEGGIPSSERFLFERGMVDICGSSCRADVKIKRQRGLLNLLPIDNHMMATKFTSICDTKEAVEGGIEGIQNRRRHKSVHTKRDPRKYCKRVSPPTEENPQGMAELVLDTIRHREKHTRRT